MLDDVNGAKAEVARARVELDRAGELEDFAKRLAELEAAVAARTRTLHWRQRGLEEVEVATRSLNLAKVLMSRASRIPSNSRFFGMAVLIPQ
jgi:hypothetical protein